MWAPNPRYRHTWLVRIASAALLSLTGFYIWQRHVDDSARGEQRHSAGLSLTSVKAHAAGFSVVENLYWHNHTFYFLTDQPWAIPEMKYLVTLNTDTSQPSNGRVAGRVLALRVPPVSPEVREERLMGDSISPEKAIELYHEAELIEGPMLINNDDNFANHYYHWIGETFLGAWRVWSNQQWSTGRQLPQIKRVAFTKLWSRENVPEGLPAGKSLYEDNPGANRWFTEKFFPGMVWDDKMVWDSRGASGKVYRIDTAIIADRSAGHNGPGSAFKPFGDVLRLPVRPEWLLDLRQNILAEYKGPTPLKMPERPLVLYLTRQDSGRRLFESDHEELLKQLEDLQAAGRADVSVEAFNSSMPFDEQVARIARATFLIGVHGNGLTHSLWMTPTPMSAVFEFQPKGVTITDYSPLAIAAGVEHYMVHEDDMCTPLECDSRGGKGINAVIRLKPTVVVDKIRQILHDNH